MSKAAWIPAIPPPTTRALRVTPISAGVRGWLARTFSTIARATRMAFSVAFGPSCTQETCSRMFAISTR
jgi:hypothetical protein